MARWLHDVAIAPADVFVHFYDALAIGEQFRPSAAQWQRQIGTDFLRQFAVSAAGEDAKFVFVEIRQLLNFRFSNV